MSLSPVISSPLSHDSTETAFALPAAELQDLLNTPPIDLRQLLENCVGNPLFAISLLEEFSRTATSRLEGFEAQSKQRNLHAIADMAHGLRGVAGILGASALSEITLDIEATCQAGDLAQTQQVIQQLRREVQRIQQELPSLSTTLNQQPAQKV